MNIIEDTYFLCSEEALRVASQENYFDPAGFLQLCYYDGFYVNNGPRNFIHLPRAEVLQRLSADDRRPPTHIDFSGAGLSITEQEIIEADIDLALCCYEEEKQLEFERLVQEAKGQVLDFEKKLRVYIGAAKHERVVRRAYESIGDAFSSVGYDVAFDINKDTECMDEYRRVKLITEFQPHITININRMRNEYLSDEVFNIIWFQDPTLILFDDTSLYIRDRDYFFYISDILKEALVRKGVPESKLFKQSFSTDCQFYFLDKSLRRENKAIFIGSNYFNISNPTIEYKTLTELETTLGNMLKDRPLSYQELDEFSDSVPLEVFRRPEHLTMFYYPAVVRKETVKWLCLQDGIDIEIYGEGWEDVEEVVPYYKGKLEYGSEVARMFNSAKYSLVGHPYFYYQQRLTEASACGCVSLVYETPTNREEFLHKKNVLMFSNMTELRERIGEEPEKDVLQISKDLSYISFAKRIKKLVFQNMLSGCY